MAIFGMLKVKDPKQSRRLAAKLVDGLAPELLGNSNYLVRLGFVLGLKKSLSAVGAESGNPLKQVLVKVSKDKIPNVKLALLEVTLLVIYL